MGHSIEHQRGSIVVIALITIIGVGTIAASMVSVLSQSGVNAAANAEFAEGMGVSDSMRLAVDDGRDEAESMDDISENPDFKDGEAVIEAFTNTDAGTTGYAGLVGQGDDRYGYRFNTTGFNPDAPVNFQPGADLKGCTDNGTSVNCKWNNGNSPDTDQSYKFESDSVIDLNPNANVRFGSVLVFEGDVNIGPNNPSQPYREIDADTVIVSGDLTSDFTINTTDEFEDCENVTVSSSNFGNGAAIFNKLAVGGEVNNTDTHGTFTYTENFDCTDEVNTENGQATVRLDSLVASDDGSDDGAGTGGEKRWSFSDG